MEPKRKYIAIAVVLAVVVFAAGLWTGRSGLRDPEGDETPAASSTPVAGSGETAGEKTLPAGAVMEDGTTAPDPQAQAKCEADLKREVAARKSSYEPGSVLVSFVGGTTFAEAKAFLDSRGLALHNGPSLEESYKAQGWLSVAVPKGTEFKYACLLREFPIVKYANVNPVFKLAE